MNPKHRALIWEQSRVAGVLALWCAAVSALIIAFIWSQYHLNPSIQRPDALSASLIIYFATAMAFAALLVLRQDSTGQMRPGFETRHARLPINTIPLVTVQAATRLTCLFLLCGALLTLHGALYGETPRAFYVFIPVTIYLFSQTLSWCHHAIPGISYMTAIALFLFPALLAASGNYKGGYFSALEAMARNLGRPGALFFLLPIAYGLSLLGVHWARRDERHGLLTERELLDWFVGLGASPAERFPSPLAAQAWYEWRRIGLLLPLFTLLGITAAAILLASLPGLRENASVVAQFVPLVVMPLVALVVSAISYSGRSGYVRLRPAAIRVFSDAKFLALGRSLTWTVLLVCALSLGGFLLFGQAEVALLREALHHGETNYFEIAAILLAPCLLSAVIAGVILLGILHAVVLYCWPAVPALLAVLLSAGIRGEHPMPEAFHDLFYLIWVLGPLAIVGGSLLWTAWRGWITRAGLAASFVFWAIISGALYLISPDADGAWLRSLLACVAISGYVAVIPAALPFTVYLRRRAR